MNELNSTDVVVATLVPDAERLDFLPTMFGTRLMMHAETLVYTWMDALSPDYSGGFWNFYALSNGGGYLAPQRTEALRVAVEGNGFAGFLSGDAAGIVATLFALCELAASVREDSIVELYHALRDFAVTHQEAALIFRAID
jgi:Antirestriction protein